MNRKARVLRQRRGSLRKSRSIKFDNLFSPTIPHSCYQMRFPDFVPRFVGDGFYRIRCRSCNGAL